jgi:hypothetical protein
LGLAGRHLSIPLVLLEIERSVSLHFLDPAILGLATIAHEAAPHYEEQHEVNQGRGKEDTEGPPWLVIRPRNGAADDSQDNDSHAAALRDVLADEQIATGTNEAAADRVVQDGALGHGDPLLAMGTFQHVRCVRELAANTVTAGGTTESYIHVPSDIESNESWVMRQL